MLLWGGGSGETQAHSKWRRREMRFKAPRGGLINKQIVAINNNKGKMFAGAVEGL